MIATNRVKKLINLIYYGMTNRYGNLTKEIKRQKSRRIMEVGVWNGRHSKSIIAAALESSLPSQVEFYGFDLFEDGSDMADGVLLPVERVKRPPSLRDVQAYLQPYRDMGVKISLYKGDTTKVIPPLVSSLPQMDFVFIDGGHSYETVKSDWDCVSQLIGSNSIVLFDDYIGQEGISKTAFGVNKLIDELDREQYEVSFLSPVDRFRHDWGILSTRFVRVVRRI